MSKEEDNQYDWLDITDMDDELFDSDPYWNATLKNYVVEWAESELKQLREIGRAHV